MGFDPSEPDVKGSAPVVLLCEGSTDAAFLRTLIEQRGLPSYRVIWPCDTPLKGKKRDPGGKSGFEVRLRALDAEGWEDVRGVLIISDNDTDQHDSFLAICDQIANTTLFERPDAIGVPKATDGRPPIAVVMIPIADVPGQLETLCIESMSSARPKIALGVDDLIAFIGMDDWSQSQIEKMRVRTMVSAGCKDNPYVAMSYVWSSKKCAELIPVSHSCFNDIANALIAFHTAVIG